MFPLGKKYPAILSRYSQTRTIYGANRTGNREIVGHGVNGTCSYKDDAAYPFPAVRFKEMTRDICALREKEKCDWRMLCCEEKKALYRASFCQTFAEFQHPTGEWKLLLGCILFTTSFGFWMAMFFQNYVFEPMPESFSKASRKAQLRRMLELRVNPIDGISSKWDYDNDRWKRLAQIGTTALLIPAAIASVLAVDVLRLKDKEAVKRRNKYHTNK